MADQPSTTPETENQTGPASVDSGPAPVPAGKADVGKRIVAGLIDAVVAAVATFVVAAVAPVLGGLVGAAYWVLRDGLNLQFMDHRSIGKKVMKLRPVTLDGTPMDITASVKRNWMFGFGGLVTPFAMNPILGLLFLILLIPLALVAFGIGIIEIILVLTDKEGRRLGDKMANTKVIEVDA